MSESGTDRFLRRIDGIAQDIKAIKTIVEQKDMSIFKSWKTALMGLITLATYILPLVGVPIPPEVAQGIITVAVGMGLVTAKDGNVTGGTVDTGKRPVRKSNTDGAL